MKRRQKGDPPEPGAGRPPGSRSFKKILEEALERETNAKDGTKTTLKDAAALKVLAVLLGADTDDNTRLRAFQIIQDALGEGPSQKIEHSGKDGGEIQVKKTVVIELTPDDGSD